MRRLTSAPLALVIAVGCGARSPASPPASPSAPSAAAARDSLPAATLRTTGAGADVRFVRGMLAHHAQALVMTALVPERTTREDIRLVAERIAISQRDEMAAMRRWLARRGESAPEGGAHDAHGAHAGGHGAAMPGMLTEEEIGRLQRAGGAEFDRLFLEYMIRHHDGALTMVAELLGTPGAAQDPELFNLASDVDADQRAEIRRMRAMTTAPPGGASRR